MSRYRHKQPLGFLIVAAIHTVIGAPALAQGGYNDDRVMIQGFMWESHQKGEYTGSGGHKYAVDWQDKWYDHVRSKAGEIADAKFDLIWLPPPSQGEGAGYHPKELYNFANNYGSKAQHQALLAALLAKGIEPIADVVINHRNGSDGWAVFKNPAWPAEFICSTDEFWDQAPDSVTPQDKAILESSERGAIDYCLRSDYNWNGARDLDHTNPELRKAIETYLNMLKALGYRGWRYDMVKGFDPQYVGRYNRATKPTFAVGEFWDADPLALSRWIDATRWRAQPDPPKSACCAFDFATYERLKDLIGNGKYKDLRAITFKDGQMDGLIAVNKDKAVTFIENHDTGFPQKQFDSFGNDAKLLQAYAFILTHPGIPCVYWKHYFDWNRGDAIKALIRARKYAGVHSGSYIRTEDHGESYVAVVGDKPSDSSTLIVKIGPGLEFKPDEAVWELETFGDDYAVWVRRARKAETKPVVDKAKEPLPAPQ
ncbi:MAG: alpha-amylase [Phycisphaerae bacterium]|nr:alpha-amylase [Phycisphaerae bacterium]